MKPISERSPRELYLVLVLGLARSALLATVLALRPHRARTPTRASMELDEMPSARP